MTSSPQETLYPDHASKKILMMTERNNRMMNTIFALCAFAALSGAQSSNQSSNKQPPKVPEQQTSQPSSSRLPPLQLDGNLALHHLNQVISWYRHATTEVHPVGLPSDAIYQDNTKSLGAQVIRLAFQSAKSESAIIAAQEKARGAKNPSSTTTQAQNLTQLEQKTSSQIDQLQSQIQTIDEQLRRAPASRRTALTSQRDALQSQLDLQKALLEAIQKMASFVETNGEIAGGLEGDINRLAKSIPEVLGAENGQKAATTPAAAKPTLANSGGLISEAITLYDYMSAVRQIDQIIKETDYTRGVADQLRTPLRDALRATIQQSQQLANQTPATDPQQLQAERQTFEELTDRFKQLSSALMPLSQEIIVLNDAKSNFSEWNSSITRESKYVLRSVVVRVVGIFLALAVILIVSEVWRRVTFRYVGDPRRRRQFLVLRRVVTGVLFVIVLVLGFVSEFSSLATFAGFITAGIAVGLQAVLLSVAAYFFIIGRYGIRVGDRISVAGITGDVVDIGLVRLYLMELAGTGVDFYPTGRIVVFSNSVLFQAGTPLFKQIPGTEYSWHEVVVMIAPGGNHKSAQEKLVAAVNGVYSKYEKDIERQHAGIERRVDIQIDIPRPAAHLQFVDTGLELLVRYPVEIRNAPAVDEEITRKVLDLVNSDAELKTAVSGTPKIRSAVKG
ncbi:MAG TPA: mechanosensitive ion channel family protein [Candidatus Acidoferrales bacterium]|nr:mechanosensitive ion channel family protein [Candidatus Acidoferrales bacterium]